MQLKELKSVPFDIGMLKMVYPGVSSISNKASQLEQSGDIVRLKRGLYVNSPQTSGTLICEFLVANHIYGPSYVSLETALRYYGLVPERIRVVRSMTLKHTRNFENNLGRFEYLNCAPEYYAIGVRMITEDGMTSLVATPEKALCDLLLTQRTGDIRFLHELKRFIQENLRLDMDAFHKMDKDLLRECASIGKKKQLINNLIKLI